MTFSATHIWYLFSLPLVKTKSATLQFCSVALSLRTDGQCKKKGNLWNGVMV